MILISECMHLFKRAKLKIPQEVFALSKFLRNNSDTGLWSLESFTEQGKVIVEEVIGSVIGGRVSTITEELVLLYRNSRLGLELEWLWQNPLTFRNLI